MENREECWVLKGRIIGTFWIARYDRYSVGRIARVAFDPEYVEDNHTQIVGWLHTHPHWIASPSITDLTTMRAWVLSLGRPLLCMIESTTELRAYWFMDDESEPIDEGWFIRIGKYIIGRMPPSWKKNSPTKSPTVAKVC